MLSAKCSSYPSPAPPHKGEGKWYNPSDCHVICHVLTSPPPTLPHSGGGILILLRNSSQLSADCIYSRVYPSQK